MNIIRFLTGCFRCRARHLGHGPGQPSIRAGWPTGPQPLCPAGHPEEVVSGRGRAGCVGVLSVRMQAPWDWLSGCVRVGSAVRPYSWDWRRKLQQTSVQGRVRSSGVVVAEVANAVQSEFQRKHWLVRCWTSDRVLCILLVALSGSLTGV